ncbi:hypothetical protein G4B88_014432 [Cannabis sativa]|uniref:BHLH domain-containing protein n=1 Tax=Cannabis sativa TaxID=3483 RepID=A0A7J6I9K5_CANSA|nr:hypothetical protein G4B88_014432 [Cannabis sativa]
MDYIPPNSNIQLLYDNQATTTDELFQLISKNEIIINQEHHHDHDHDDVTPPTPSQKGCEPIFAGGRRRKSSNFDQNQEPNDDDDDDQNPNDKKKKVIHRDIERQRRQEMSALYASLRSLIPLQYLKGKRSTSDQIHEVANYIRDLERKMERMKAKRDSLKKMSDSSDNNEIINLESTKIISLRHCSKRRSVEVFSISEGFSLHKLILRALSTEGLDVISCVSAKVNQRFLHTIQTEAVSEERSFDLSKLEQKLNNLIV